MKFPTESLSSSDLEDLATKYSETQLCAILSYRRRLTCPVSTSAKFGFQPIANPKQFRRALEQDATQWEANKVQFDQDAKDFDAMPAGLQKPLLEIFSFFLVGDGSVVESILFKMLALSPTTESQKFYISQLYNEQTHALVYSNMVMTLVRHQEDRDRIMKAVESNATIAALNDFIGDISVNVKKDGEIYFALALAEFAMFMPLFAVIFWYKEHRPGTLKSIMLANRWIARDEFLHANNGACNYREQPKDQQLTIEEGETIVNQVVDLMNSFTDSFLGENTLEGLTPDVMREFNQYVANDFLVLMGHLPSNPITENPIDYMKTMGLAAKGNGFELVVSEYTHLNAQEDFDRCMFLGTTAPLSDGKSTATDWEEFDEGCMD